MNRKYQRQIDGVKHIIAADDIDREISRSETRILSARDSMSDFWYVLSFAFLIGSTSIGTALWYEANGWLASWHGLQLSLAVFAFFSLWRHINIWWNIRPEETYKKALMQRRVEVDRENKLIRQQHAPARIPKPKEVEFE